MPGHDIVDLIRVSWGVGELELAWVKEKKMPGHEIVDLFMVSRVEN